jgi:hypothetical protein
MDPAKAASVWGIGTASSLYWFYANEVC